MSEKRYLARPDSHGAILAWIDSEAVFLKVQKGTGDNLSDEDIDDGFIEYLLWNTFMPESLGIDEELEMKLVDSGGMVLLKRPIPDEEAVIRCFREAFGRTPDDGDIRILIREI